MRDLLPQNPPHAFLPGPNVHLPPEAAQTATQADGRIPPAPPLPRYEWEYEVFYDMAAGWLTRRDFRAIAPRTVKTVLCEHVQRKLREMG